jgi:hypothetical protein
MDFVGASDALFNLNRNKRDDIPIEVNPSGIRADVSPSIRAVKGKSVESPDSGLSASRSSAGVQAMREAFANMPQAIFQGEVPRVGGADLSPSGRAMPSQPTGGFISTKGSMIGAIAGGASSGGSLDDYRFNDQSVYDRPPELPLAELPGMGKQESAQPAVSEKKSRISLTKQYDVGSEERERQNKLWSKQEAKRQYPTKQALMDAGYKSLKEAEDDIYEQMAEGMKRGGRVHSAF